MRIVLQRQTENSVCTMGEMTIEGSYAAWTLERQGPQFPSDYHSGPAGIYKVVLYPSPKFGRVMPLLENVPDCPYCEIHFGNWPHDSHGCILVGSQRGENMIYNSQLKFNEIYPLIEAAVKSDGCDIEIKDIPVAL